jgi:hypothetical protein
MPAQYVRSLSASEKRGRAHDPGPRLERPGVENVEIGHVLKPVRHRVQVGELVRSDLLGTDPMGALEDPSPLR